MFKNVRRKVANAISREKSQDYPVVELNWATPQSENKRILEKAHRDFEKKFGRPAVNHAEAWKWDREEVHKLLKEMDLEPSNPSTEFIPEHFFVGEELEEYYKQKNTPVSTKKQG